MTDNSAKITRRHVLTTTTLGLGALAVGCSGDPTVDAGLDSGRSLDGGGGGTDGALTDAGRADAQLMDGSALSDGGVEDASAVDVGDADARADTWRYTQFQSPAEGRAWNLVLAHDTGEMTREVIDANWDRPQEGRFPFRRVSMRAAPDGLPAFHEQLDAGYICDPIGLWSTIVAFNNADARYYHLRYHEWTTGYTGTVDEGGKRHLLFGGRSWVAEGYMESASSNLSVSQALGSTDGWGVNLMRPVRDSGVDFAGFLGSHREQSSLYGTTRKSNSSPITPLGRWVTYDVVADMGDGRARSGAYRAYLDGVMVAQLANITPYQDRAAACRCIGWRIRNMVGGTPRLDPIANTHERYSGGFFLSTAS